ncbi:unnamed protein product [Darwinula stevensoni]|uniref:Calcium-activated chloride channel N-terminal domain-containing protein n=1 Tax=Darwinula stevensoni TaxID=69355 RepID=A0A7R9A9I9_9CRUS|nr:unnamed protein product [Darwinula stevensoni]CAG0897416.1 unnamed protein product [Darwinula stevensoni]
MKDVFKNASRALFRATKDLSFFRSVKVVIPKHWDVGECARGISFTTGTLPWVHTLRGFQVGPPTPRNGDLPSTLQPWGCGHPGHHIYLPFTYFLGEAGLGFGDPGRILVREWAKYRYGVFEEAGYPQDPLYPSYFTPYLESGPEMEAPTGCSNGHVKGNRICSGDSCHFLPDNKGSNDDITSSLMSYLPILPNVEDFCDEKNHNADAPTQHNALCSGKSTWEIISSHPDFSQNPVPLMGKPSDPKFEFVKSQARKVFLLLDASSGGNVQLDQNRWEWTRSSVYRFLELLSHDPEQVELSLAHFALEMEEVPPLSPVNTFGLSNPRLVSRYPSANRTACIGCALDKIAQIIQEGSMKGAEVILLTRNAYLDRHDIAMADWDRMESVLASFDTVIHSVSADGQDQSILLTRNAYLDRHDIAMADWDRMESVLASFDTVIHSVSADGQDQSEVRLRRRSVLSDLVRGSGGRELHLDMTGDVTDMVAILNALEALVTPHSSFKVLEEVGSPSQYGKVRGRFMLDPSLTTATFTAYYGQEPRDVKVTSPSGRVLSQSPRLQAHYHAYIIDIPTIDMEEGMWEYQVDAFSMDRVGIEIRAKADPETEISLRGSTSWDHIQIPDPQVFQTLITVILLRHC